MIFTRVFLFIGLAVTLNPCPPSWIQIANSCYWYSNYLYKSWADANAYCESIGGNLGSTYNRSILSAAELLFGPTTYPSWSGLHKVGSIWKFIDKASFSSTQWAKGEPNAARGSCGAIRKSSDADADGYVSLSCSYAQPFLCSQKIASCSKNNLTSIKGTIQSPNYPSNYANNENCAQFIIAPKGYFVELVFDVWFVEKNLDVVLIYDGFVSDPTSSLLANITIDPTNDTVALLKNSFQTVSNVMSVVFRTDGSVNFKGWHANYVQRAVFPSVFVNGTGGTVTSPNYPSTYPPNVEQFTFISTADDTQIIGKFTYFDTEANKDYLLVFDGPDNTYPLIGNLSGHGGIPPPLLSSNNSLTLYFQTDNVLNYKGFSLNWNIV